jgi:L-threonylcarbamoyladenylate synthase
MEDFESDIKQSLQVLQAGGLILYPTDTIWGIGCDATNTQAVAKVFALKQRAEHKSLVMLLADARDLIRYLGAPPPDIQDRISQMDRPTTVIYDQALHFAPNAIAADGTVAIRLVKEDFCRHLIKRFRKPIVSTSANISGHPAPAHFGLIDPQIIGGVDYVVQYRQSDRSVHQPSQIIRILKDGTEQILRK